MSQQITLEEGEKIYVEKEINLLIQQRAEAINKANELQQKINNLLDVGDVIIGMFDANNGTPDIGSMLVKFATSPDLQNKIAFLQKELQERKYRTTIVLK